MCHQDEQVGLREYFDCHGPQHSIEDCPQDDTCECPESRKLREAWTRMGRETELAHRRLDKIKRALATIYGVKP
jgi:hypothetical protein